MSVLPTRAIELEVGGSSDEIKPIKRKEDRMAMMFKLDGDTPLECSMVSTGDDRIGAFKVWHVDMDRGFAPGSTCDVIPVGSNSGGFAVRRPVFINLDCPFVTRYKLFEESDRNKVHTRGTGLREFDADSWSSFSTVIGGDLMVSSGERWSDPGTILTVSGAMIRADSVVVGGSVVEAVGGVRSTEFRDVCYSAVIPRDGVAAVFPASDSERFE